MARHEITAAEDINRLFETFGGFHDSCLKELSYVSGAYVNDDLSMYPINSERVIKAVFQRQQRLPKTIEMTFAGVKYCLLRPVGPEYTCEILGATAFFKDGAFCWYDSDCISEEDFEKHEGTVICAEKAYWEEKDG